ncbi:MAG: polyprenyl synthetase family protein [Flavobacteriales bacterium]
MKLYSLEEVRAIIHQQLEDYQNSRQTDIERPIQYILSLGGKRIRPALTLLASNLFSDDITQALHPALAIEVFHNFTLMHDDIMDNAPLRRGMPTVHEKWNRDTAILSGDAMLIQSYELLIQTPASYLSQILPVFNRTAMEVCIGQQMDMDFQHRRDVSIEEYLEMIRLKTSVLLAGAMEIGAWVGGASKEDAKHLYDFGVRLGVAFQLWDDYLDAFGDPAMTGKQPGGDILADKKTFLHITALHRASPSQVQRLNDWHGQTADQEKKVKEMISLYRELGVDQSLEEHAQKLHREALQALNAVSVNQDRKQPLLQLAEFLLNRKH